MMRVVVWDFKGRKAIHLEMEIKCLVDKESALISCIGRWILNHWTTGEVLHAALNGPYVQGVCNLFADL